MSTQQKTIRDWGVIIAAVLSMACTLYVESQHTDRQNTADIATLKQARQDDHELTVHIQQQVDRLVNELIEKKGSNHEH